MALLAFYWGVMILCYFIASKLRYKKEKFSFLEQLLNIVIYVLVFIMGLRMGSNEEVISNLGTIGVQSIIVTALVVGGSMFAVFLLDLLWALTKRVFQKYEVKLKSQIVKLLTTIRKKTPQE